LIVAFNLDGAAITLLHQQAARRGATAAGGGVIIRDARNELVIAYQQWNGLLYGRTTASRSHDRQAEAHEGKEIATRGLESLALLACGWIRSRQSTGKFSGKADAILQLVGTLPILRRCANLDQAFVVLAALRSVGYTVVVHSNP